MNKQIILDSLKEPYTTQIHGLSHDGRGIATIDNKTAFIAGCLPNEVVKYRITQKRSTYVEAMVQDIIHASSERQTPPCPHFGLCGGCSLQHMSAETQIL